MNQLSYPQACNIRDKHRDMYWDLFEFICQIIYLIILFIIIYLLSITFYLYYYLGRPQAHRALRALLNKQLPVVHYCVSM